MEQLKAKAKINLFFHITGKREDGYHLIDSLTVFAEDIYDLIKVDSSCAALTRINAGEFAYLLKDEKNNLIDKAIKEFADNEQYNCTLTKNIPIGAGLGGGSSDAATVLKYIKPNLNIKDLLKIGADLPVCYHGEPAYCSGIGEIIQPIKNFPSFYLVLVNPKKILLTKDVFKINKNIDTAYIENKPNNFDRKANKLIEFLINLSNDLKDSAIELLPEIKVILTLIEEQENCKLARMSGSGPTCFGMFENERDAIKACENILSLHPEYWVKVTNI